jgi:hypothetical protein
MNIVNLPNLGVIEHQFTAEQLEPIWQEVRKIQADFEHSEKYNNNLVGNIKHEYVLKESMPYIETLMLPMIAEYEKHYQYLDHLRVNSQLTSVSLQPYPWVNFMSANEINPLHNHSGVLSFVIWLQIPFDRQQEIDKFPDLNPAGVVAGSFDLIFLNILGQMTSYRKLLATENEGCAILFPASMSHMVYPFTENNGKHRISVSGNFVFNFD